MKKDHGHQENLNKEVAQLNEKYLRSLADYQNLQRQTDTWKEEFTGRANQDLITKLLEILDDLEKACEHLQDEGLKIILEKFQTILKNNGLEELEVLGKDFDPGNCEAIGTVPGEVHHKIIRVEQKGYLLNNKVIRAAKVLVSSKENL